MPQNQKPNARLHEKKRRNKRLARWRKKQEVQQAAAPTQAAKPQS